MSKNLRKFLNNALSASEVIFPQFAPLAEGAKTLNKTGNVLKSVESAGLSYVGGKVGSAVGNTIGSYAGDIAAPLRGEAALLGHSQAPANFLSTGGRELGNILGSVAGGKLQQYGDRALGITQRGHNDFSLTPTASTSLPSAPKPLAPGGGGAGGIGTAVDSQVSTAPQIYPWVKKTDSGADAGGFNGG